MVEAFGRREGRALFGHDPAAYDAARPGHAEPVYEVLQTRCGLGVGTAVLEVGPGTGQVTKRLLAAGARPVLVEPDHALGAYLDETLGDAVELRLGALEDVHLPARAFSVAVAASSFHWVDEPVGLERVHAALEPHGWIALWWTLFGVDDESDAFIEATTPLLAGLQPSPSRPDRGPPFALDTARRVHALEAAGFDAIEHETTRWTATWNTAGIRALYSTFSPIARLRDPLRTRILDGVARIAEEDFGGVVSRVLTTALYTARKPT